MIRTQHTHFSNQISPMCDQNPALLLKYSKNPDRGKSGTKNLQTPRPKNKTPFGLKKKIRDFVDLEYLL